MSALERRLARLAAAHEAATAPHWWACRVPGCDGSRRPAVSPQAAQAAAMAHHDAEHPRAVPADLEEQRARWVAAGCPPLGPWNAAHPFARHVAQPPRKPLGSPPTAAPSRGSAWDNRTEDTWIDRL